MRLSTKLVKKIMELAPADTPAVDDPRYSQVFRHESYVHGSETDRRSVRTKHSQYRFDYEHEVSMFDNFFPDYPMENLKGSRLLDLGCLTGGRTAAWTEQFEFDRSVGFDVDVEYVKAGKEFAQARNDNSTFCVSYGEAIPFKDESFDVVASYDVIEHVADFEMVFAEASRVLVPGGLFFVVFPTYYQPLASHLQLATRVRGLLNLFPGDVVARAFFETISDRGPDHAWYNLESSDLPDFYKSPFLNGITVRDFKQIAAGPDWEVVHWPRRPIFTVGRRAEHPVFQTLAKIVRPLAEFDRLEEVFLTNVTCILSKSVD